ncbi:MAG: DNA polymerase III subunit delta [Bacteroidia bacterium]
MRFADIPGQEEIKAKLVSSIKEERIPHAQLFLGPEGSHNLSLAIACIQMMYCSQPLEDDSCGSCSSCSKISKHMHPDVHYSYPTAGAKQISTTYINEWRQMLSEHPLMNASDWMAKIAKDENKTPNITREESRDILSKLSLKPFEGEAKALIIWMPEYLDKIGNSLLKIIEEPPQRTFFILVAHQFDAILPTVSSRTQLVKIGTYQNEELVGHLRERYDLEQAKAENIAFLADGNMREAVMMVEEVDDNYSELFRKMMLACYQNDLSTVSKFTDELARLGRNQIQLYLQNGLKILRETLLYKSIDDYEIKFVGEYKDFIRNFSSTMNAKLIEESYRSINEVIYHIGRNANAKISLFNLSLALRHNFIRKR